MRLHRRNRADSSPVAEQAQARLSGSSYPILRRVLCEFDDGVMTLRGRLPSFFHKQLAQEAVFGMENIVQVDNQIEVVAAT